MTDPFFSQRVVAKAAAAVGSNPAEFLTIRGNREMWQARFAAYLVMREHGLKVTQIARRMKRDHTTVSEGVRRARNLRSVSPAFASLCAQVAA